MGISRSIARALLLIGLMTVSVSCKSADEGQFQCINDGDCPPGCACETDFVTVGVCENGNFLCGGTCDAETPCPQGTTCRLARIEGDLQIYECLGGDLGATCASNAECDPNASSLGAFCCLDAEACGQNLGQCVEDCSMYSSGGVVQDFEGADCENDAQCGEFLFCCLVPDAAGNCDFELDQSCTCRADPGS